jgi:Fur family ferric uptake transcriptional regulator
MGKKTPEKIHLEKLLRAGGFRITSGRVILFQLLAKAQKPLSIQAISKRWKGMPPNSTTLYRTLTDLAKAGIVRRMDLNTGTAHFEYTPDSPHHHHVVCTNCDDIEDFESQELENVIERLVGKSSKFKNVEHHSLELFGLCRMCA